MSETELNIENKWNRDKEGETAKVEKIERKNRSVNIARA